MSRHTLHIFDHTTSHYHHDLFNLEICFWQIVRVHVITLLLQSNIANVVFPLVKEPVF